MHIRFPLLIWTAAFALLGALLISANAQIVHASSSGVVISAIYGGGGNSGKPDWKYDYVELFNAGTTAVRLKNWTLQYAAAGQTTWNNVTYLPTFWLLPGQYYLVQEGASQAGGGAPLPSPDFVNDLDPRHLSSTSHKVALFSTVARFDGGVNPAGHPDLVDLVGYGDSNAHEGSGPAPIINTEKQIVRRGKGCQDSDNNAADFTAVDHFIPRSTTSSIRLCGNAKELLANSDFNVDVNADLIPDGWLLKNRSGDKSVCNTPDKRVSFAGQCAVLFKGGAGEDAKLQQTVKVNFDRFSAGDRLTLSGYFKGKNSAVRAELMLKVKYADRPPVKTSATVALNDAYKKVSAPVQTLPSGNLVKIKVIFKHRSPAGKIWFDGASLVHVKSGTRDNGLNVLPVPAPPNGR